MTSLWPYRGYTNYRNCMFILIMRSSPSFCLIIPTATFLSRPKTQCTEKIAANRLLLFFRTVWWSLWSEMCQVNVSQGGTVGMNRLRDLIVLLRMTNVVASSWECLRSAWAASQTLLLHRVVENLPGQLMPAPSRLVRNLMHPSLLEL